MCYNSVMSYHYIFPNIRFAHTIDEDPRFFEEDKERYHLLYELFYLKEGDVELILENKKYRLTDGDVALIRPGQYHRIAPRGTSAYDCYTFHFSEELVPSELSEALRKPPTCCTFGENTLLRLPREVDRHCENYSGKHIRILLESFLRVFLVYFCESGAGSYKTPVFYHKKMTEVIDFIHENIAKPLKISDICDRFHYSKSYICKEFSKSMDVPIMQYVRTKKILLADSLIKQGQKPTEVCKQCGFSDYSTFFRDYCKTIGNPPSGTNK